MSEARRLKALEDEYAKLKQGGAEESFGKKFLTDAAKREAVVHLQACHGMSERRACRVIDPDRKSVRCRSTRDMTRVCSRSYANWSTSDGGSAIAVCISCCAVRGS